MQFRGKNIRIVCVAAMWLLCLVGVGIVACGPVPSAATVPTAIDGYVSSTPTSMEYLSWEGEQGGTTLTGVFYELRLNPDQGVPEAHSWSITGRQEGGNQLTINETPMTTLQGSIKDDGTLDMEQSNTQGQFVHVIWYGVSSQQWNDLKQAFPKHIQLRLSLDVLGQTVKTPNDLLTADELTTMMHDRRHNVQSRVDLLDTIEQQTDHTKRCYQITQNAWRFQPGDYNLLPRADTSSLSKQLQQTQADFQTVKQVPLPANLKAPVPWALTVAAVEKEMAPAQQAMKALQQKWTQYHPEDVHLQGQYNDLVQEFQKLQKNCVS